MQRAMLAGREIRLSGEHVLAAIGERVLDLGKDRGGFGQAPGAVFAARHLALVGVDDINAVVAQLRDIALRRRVLPHAHVHRGHREHRRVGREQQRGGKVVGVPRRHLGDEVGGGGRNDDQVGLARQLDMSHLDLILEVPERGEDLVFGQGGERHRRDEMRSALGQDAAHAHPRLADQPDELARLVSGNPAADDQEDVSIGHQYPVSSMSSAFMIVIC